MKMFRYWILNLMKFWIFCCEVSKIESVTNESRSTTTIYSTLPQILTIPFPLEDVTALPPDWSLHNVILEEVKFYIKTQSKVREYLAGFKNAFQRFVVESQMTYCPYITLCNFNMNATTDQKSCCSSCSCDNLCETKQNCCPSVINETKFNYDSNTTVLFNGTNIISYPRAKEREELVKPTCNFRILTIRPHSYEKSGFMAVSDCPAHSDLELLYNCTRSYTDILRLSVKYILPVYSNASLTIFRNKFCALCNGIHEKYIMFFRPKLSCANKEHFLTQITSEHDLIQLIFANDSCDLYAVSDERVKLKECTNIISKCNVTAFWKDYDMRLDLACNLYESVFTHENYVFRNVFCAMCNGITPHSVTCYKYLARMAVVFSFSGLLNLDFDQGFSTTYLAQNRDNQGTSCNTSQLYDALTNRCKEIYCPEMRKLLNGGCINIYTEVYNDFKFNLYIRLTPLSSLSAADLFANGSNWLFIVESVFRKKISHLDLCEAQMLFKLNLDFGKSTLQTLSRSRLQYVDAQIILFEESKEPWRVADNLIELHQTKVKILNDDNTSTSYIIYVMDHDARIFDNTKTLLNNTDFQSNFMASSTPEKRFEIMSKYALTDTDGATLLPYTFRYLSNINCYHNTHKIDVIRFSSCPKVILSKEDIPWTKDLDGLVFKTLKIPSNKYYIIDHLHIMLCIDMFRKIVDHLTPERVLTPEVIVSITCSSLSIFSLLVTFLVYCIIPKLRTPLPGKNNMSLTVNILVAQIMLLVGSLGPFEQFSTPCKVVGVLIHFIWLSAVFWMNVCTYHMSRVMTNMHASITDYGMKTFLFYTLYVFIMSALFVIANVISSTLTTSNIGYGGKFCYIISKEKLLFTFVLPTLVVIVVNISLFVAVIIKVRRAPSIRKHVKNDYNDIVIFAKLSTITGLTWVFGFLYLWSGIQTFSYIFIVLNAGQGVFILLAFVLNRKVLNLFKERIRLSNRRHRNPSDLSNRTSSSKL